MEDDSNRFGLLSKHRPIMRNPIILAIYKMKL